MGALIMRFLFTILAVIWVLFSWVCFNALRWQPPLPRPQRLEQVLHYIDLNELDTSIEKLSIKLESKKITPRLRALYLFDRAKRYWLKTYIQNSRVAQQTYFKLALKDAHSAAAAETDNPAYFAFLTDLYFQMQKNDKANEFFNKTKKRLPDELFQSVYAYEWQSPLPKPWHVKKPLEHSTYDDLNRSVEETTIQLELQTMDDYQRAQLYYIRARCYWLKSYLQNSHLLQMAFLTLSQNDCHSALRLIPDNPTYIYSIGDLYHQMQIYDKARQYYQKALKFQPDDSHIQRRYHDLKEDIKENQNDKSTSMQIQ